MNFSIDNYFDEITHHLCFHSIEFDWNINFDNFIYLYMSSLYYDMTDGGSLAENVVVRVYVFFLKIRFHWCDLEPTLLD